MASDANAVVQWLSESERRAWLAVATLTMKLPPALDRRLERESDLSFFEYMVLAMLSEQGDRTLQMSEIADLVSVSLSRLSHAAVRLDKQGLITREQIPGHGRRTRATLTDAGFEKVRNTAPAHVTDVRELFFAGHSPDEITTLTVIAERALRTMSEWTQT